jgi:[ribosomal protein S18]-alanine N-acetyltransferase
MQKSSGRAYPLVAAEMPGRKLSVQIRPCLPVDLSQVKIILDQSQEASAWSMEVLLESLNQYPKYFLIATQAKEIVGFISGRAASDEGEILNLAVKTQVRRTGLGQTLLQALLDVFREGNVLQVFLEVRESNVAAIRFYAKAGFHQVGARPAYYRNPDEAALVFAYHLPSPKSESQCPP